VRSHPGGGRNGNSITFLGMMRLPFPMNRLRHFLSKPRTLIVIGIALLALLFLLGGSIVKALAFWIGVALVGVLIVMLGMAIIHHIRARRSSEELGDALLQTSDNEGKGRGRNADVDALHQRLREAVKSIKTSRLGETKGTEALYELPWYMIIGNPAAGKSTAIVNSGLRFPFADQQGSIIQGIGGTRNCDWYFTTEGILLDTAGRYSVHEENRSEWLSFLELLRKHRPRAPINGIIIAASIAELTDNRPEFAIDLAKKLRQRVQELTEWLQVIAPVYVIFTKADLIAGFNDFFHTLDDDERERVWGTTLPFQADGSIDAADQFDRHFDELSEGLKEMSLSQMSLHRGSAMAPGLLTLPLEFTGIKASLRTFITTLFEDNPFQYRPVFRGFYFTSALQETASVHHASERIAKLYGLSEAEAQPTPDGQASENGYFLLDLFRKVIFADRQLVRQYSSRNRTRTRYAALLGSALILVLALGSWGWSYYNNRQLIAQVQTDLHKAVELQKGRIDLQSRLQALQILQNRLKQLDAYNHDHPLMLGLGLYQGNIIEKQLRAEYFNGMRQLMLAPVTQNLESYLTKVVAHGKQLGQTSAKGNAGSTVQALPGDERAPSPTNTEDAYNALKTYLMLGNAQRVEPVYLANHIERFWSGWLEANRGMMSSDQVLATADKLASFYASQYKQTNWPTVNNQIVLVGDSRQALRQVMLGMPAINRVYVEIKARAATRFSPISVASILDPRGAELLHGNYQVPGAFTREAWKGYVKKAIHDAAHNQLNTSDWVLQTSQKTDLSQTHSPAEIQKRLTALYDKGYIDAWTQFLRDVSIVRFASFNAAVADMNTLGDPDTSPMRSLLKTVYYQTSWDNPIPPGLKSSHGGFFEWFKRAILRRQPSRVHIDPASIKWPDGKLHTGPVGSAFSGVAQLMTAAQKGKPTLLHDYLAALAKLRTRLNAISNQGDPGPGTRTLMQKTLNGSGSELSSGLQLVDEQMLDGIDHSQRSILRPLLLAPLTQSFKALVQPTETEINKVWTAQVYAPFKKDLAKKYPFDTNSQVQATNSEIAQIFGPSGAIANFADSTLGPLVNRRGNTLTAKQWADMGITLSPRLMTRFPQWVAPLGQTAGSDTRTVFQIEPEPGSGGISEYTIDINGQTLRYRNTPPQWQSFVWDSTQSNPTVKISAVTYDGLNVTVENFVGANALGMLVRAADAKLNKADGTYTLTWTRGKIGVTVHLKLISGAQTNADGSQKHGLQGSTLPATVVGEIRAASTPRPATEPAS
jgi:type VI secretion system protein ImpL